MLEMLNAFVMENCFIYSILNNNSKTDYTLESLIDKSSKTNGD